MRLFLILQLILYFCLLFVFWVVFHSYISVCVAKWYLWSLYLDCGISLAWLHFWDKSLAFVQQLPWLRWQSFPIPPRREWCLVIPLVGTEKNVKTTSLFYCLVYYSTSFLEFGFFVSQARGCGQKAALGRVALVMLYIQKKKRWRIREHRGF